MGKKVRNLIDTTFIILQLFKEMKSTIKLLQAKFIFTWPTDKTEKIVTLYTTPVLFTSFLLIA